MKSPEYILVLKDNQGNLFQIENELHWTLDVTFDEDRSRVRKDYRAENLAVLHHIALNLLKQEKTCKRSVRAKRLLAGWDENYRCTVLQGLNTLNIIYVRLPCQNWCLEAERVNDHDFRSSAQGRAVPYGIYVVNQNQGYVYVGQSADTAEFAVDALALWWQEFG